MAGELPDNAEKQALATPGQQSGPSLSRKTQELFNPLTGARATDEPDALDCGSMASIYADGAELNRQRETAEPRTEQTGATVYEQPAKEAVEPMPPLTDIDGLDDAGNIMIRDPAHGTRYEMTHNEFMKVWTGIAVFRK